MGRCGVNRARAVRAIDVRKKGRVRRLPSNKEKNRNLPLVFHLAHLAQPADTATAELVRVHGRAGEETEWLRSRAAVEGKEKYVCCCFPDETLASKKRVREKFFPFILPPLTSSLEASSFCFRAGPLFYLLERAATPEEREQQPLRQGREREGERER